RMLLLLTPALPTRRGARPAGALLHRSGAAAPHRSHHAGVHVLRRVLARRPSTLGTLMAKAHAPNSSHYYIPHDSPWPIRGSIALFAIMLGAIGYLNDWSGAWSFVPGAALLAYMFFGWFSTVIGENQHGVYNLQVDRSFRMGMMWFIFSEVMFFAAFFGALFYARMLSVPWLGGEGVKVFSNFILWPQFEAVWPTNGPGHVGGRADSTFGTIPAIGVPALNTAILLTSGLTVTFAHLALRADRHVAFEAVAWYWHFVDWVWLALFIFVYWL